MTTTRATPSDVAAVGTGMPLRRVRGGWLLAGRSGEIPVTDPRVTSELDALAAALAAADRAIASGSNSKQAQP